MNFLQLSPSFSDDQIKVIIDESSIIDVSGTPTHLCNVICLDTMWGGKPKHSGILIALGPGTQLSIFLKQHWLVLHKVADLFGASNDQVEASSRCDTTANFSENFSRLPMGEPGRSIPSLAITQRAWCAANNNIGTRKSYQDYETMGLFSEECWQITC
jgi:hypothetical protein